MKDNKFGCKIKFETGNGKASIFSLEKLQKDGILEIKLTDFGESK